RRRRAGTPCLPAPYTNATPRQAEDCLPYDLTEMMRLHCHIHTGPSLIIIGLASGLFFWLTDVRFGLPRLWTDSTILVDAVQLTWPGTMFGLIGSVLILLIGLWLMRSKT